MILVSLRIMQHQGTKEMNFQCQETEWITDRCDMYNEKEAGSHSICLWKTACAGPTARSKLWWWRKRKKKKGEPNCEADWPGKNEESSATVSYSAPSDSREPSSGFVYSLSIASNPLGTEGKGDPSISKSSFCGESYITSFMSFRKLVWISIKL